ncbi:MAG: hypothetical protein LBV43_04155 [Prevotella sp.]|jgi:endonuclease/exonuclease/phosphatase family metal-dependent hydrolase|nr:hypothetical protein [Prevotella sp.]
MKTFYNIITSVFFILLISSCSSKPVQLNVMSFNIWVGGGKSLDATAQVIVDSKADIVGIQESTRAGKNMAVHIADSLGWYSYVYSNSPTIISRYPIVDTTTNKYGVKIKIDEKHFVWMFNVHLMYCPYEPYQLNGIEYCGAPLLETEQQAIESAIKSRGETVNASVADMLEVQKEGYPIFITGDFNEPSCLDWTKKATEAGLCKIPVAWPSTKAYLDKAGMKDSYRVIYPDEVKNPGHTWTTLPAENEILDRIDFLLFWGEKIKVENSQLAGESSDLSDIKFNNYPSDHRAVLSTFILE